MDIAKRAFDGLFPGKELSHRLKVKYSGRFKGYNANVRYTPREMVFGLSRNWEEVDEDIQIGLIQSLLCKAYKAKRRTTNIDYYNSFLRNVHATIPASLTEPELQDSFDRVNAGFFDGMLEPTNLAWGNGSRRTFGTYEYGTDTIKINPVLKERPHLLDYVMHHEMLHKKFKFSSSSTRSFHHTGEFRRAEGLYPCKDELEKELGSLCLRPARRSGRGVRKSRKIFDWF